ncbi:MFS transporter [Spongisporangium articulatum]|uniref:MFS transporter n=1 Tax=Spongisporangium articulatum TaxID=3362603 RepID=A0ABW8ANJ3_9ACTN
MTLLVPHAPTASTAQTRTGYRDLPRLAGSAYLPIALLARLPSAMTPIAVLAFVAAGTGSFATAGLAVTGCALGTALGAPLSGLLVDRFGQRPVLTLATLLNAGALLTLPVTGGAAALIGLGVLAGVTAPQIGAMSRTRWIALTALRPGRAPRDELTRVFMSWEGLTDEVSYIAGPALAGLLTAFAGPAAALTVAGSLAAGSGLAFALHPTHALALPRPEPVAGSRADRHGVSALVRRLLVPLLSMSAVGVLFGASQTALTAFAEAVDRPSAGGLLYSGMAVCSAFSAVLMARVPARFDHRVRTLVSGTGLLMGVLAMGAAARAGSLPLVAAAVLFTGVFVSPAMITLNSWVGELAPAGRVATAMALLASAGVTGIAVGASAAGVLADRWGALGAFSAAGVALAVQVLSLSRRGGTTDGDASGSRGD